MCWQLDHDRNHSSAVLSTSAVSFVLEILLQCNGFYGCCSSPCVQEPNFDKFEEHLGIAALLDLVNQVIDIAFKSFKAALDRPIMDGSSVGIILD